MTNPRVKIPVTCTISPDLLERLDRAAEAENRSRSNMLERVLDTAFGPSPEEQLEEAATWIEDDAPIDLD